MPHHYETVFHIDDDVITNFLSSKIIEKEKFAKKVSTFVQADEALATLREISADAPSKFPDIIFLDINMPGMDGWAFMEEYQKLPKALTSGCRLFILSAALDKKEILQARSYEEVEEFLAKPLSPEMLTFIKESSSLS
jgi:CheY-like chemotaxis protein